MKFAPDRPYADPEMAARKLIEIADLVEAVRDGRIYVELINEAMLFEFPANTWPVSIWRSSAAG
jgi:hypothetical protein